MSLEIILYFSGFTITVIVFLYVMLRNFKKDIKDDINSHLDRLDVNMKDQGKRIDHLYQISVELLRERKS